jgi:hypothetical protein
MRQAILMAEQRALDRDGYVTPRNIGAAWEKLWWPAATEAGLPLAEVERMALKASSKFRDYCHYDVTGPNHEAVGINVDSEVQLDDGILVTQVDLIKWSLKEPEPLIFIDFTRKGLERHQMTHDMALWANVYAFSGLERPITYICMDLSGQKIKSSAVYFKAYEMENIGQTLNYLARGIRKNIDYECSWRCKECNLCSKF